MNFKIKLIYKLIIVYVLLIFFFICSLAFFQGYVFKNEFNKYILENHKEESEKIVNDVLELYKDGSEPTYDELYKIGLDALDSGLILMVNESYDKQLICISDVIPSDSTSMIDRMEQTMNSVYPHFKGEYKEDMYPLDDGTNVYGYVTLGYYGPIYYSEFDVLFLKALNKSMFIISFLFFIISGFVIYFFAKRISKPITLVSKRTKEIEKGNYKINIDVDSNTIEINNLVKSINGLAKNLDNQQKVKVQMAQNYTHEIRTPITCVMTTLEGMIDGVFEVNNEKLESIYSDLERVSKMVTEVDKLIYTSSLEIKVNKEKADIVDIVNKSVESFSTLFENKNIKLETLFSISEKNIFVDAEQIKCVIINLISNAFKYTDKNGEVLVSVKENEDNVYISVKDDGIGIEKEEIENIFENLYRVEKSRVKDVDGFGIGLSISKNIVEAHSGKIYVRSEINVGSEFIVVLPKE